MNGEELKSRLLSPMDTGMEACNQKPNLGTIVMRLYERAEMMEKCVSAVDSAVRVVTTTTPAGGCENEAKQLSEKKPMTLYELLDEIDGKFTLCAKELEYLADALRDELGECKILG